MIIWLIGLSGAGKSTVSEILYKKIKAARPDTVFLDGDILREVWGDTLGHDVAGRQKNAERLSKLSQFLDSQNISAVAAVLSIFPEWRTWNREHFSDYYEVFLDVPMEEIERRDSKGLYKKFRDGEINNVVGMDIEFPRDATWDMHIEAPEVLESPERIADRILEGVLSEKPDFLG